MQFLRGEVSIDAVEDYGMWELGDGFIGYNVLRKDDLAKYYRGLAVGFGSEKMYLTMLNNQIKYGRLGEAREFFDAWQKKWGTFDTAEPYKTGGIIYAHLFQQEKAASLFHKYLELAPEKLAGEAHLLLARSLLLQQDKSPYEPDIDHEIFKTVRIQLMALQYVEVQPLNTTRASTALFWRLTQTGHAQLMRIRTVKKSPESSAT